MPTKSRWTLAIPRVTLPTFLFTSPTAELAHSPIFLDADRPSYHLTYHTFRLWSQRFAAGLVAAGLRPGEPVMLYTSNTLFFPVYLVGVIMAGGIFTGANPTYTAREVAYQLENSGARFLLVADGSLETGIEGAAQAGVGKDRVFVLDEGYDTFDGKGVGRLGCAHWSKLVADETSGRAFCWAEGVEMCDNTAALNYSSGTTGLPKGVMITHTNYVSNALQHMHLTKIKKTYAQRKAYLRWLCLIPLYHAMGQTMYCIGAVYTGIPVYIMRKFEFLKMLQYIQDYRISDLQLVPPLVVMMAKSPITRNYDLSSVGSVGSGAAPLGREITVEFQKLWPPGVINLKQGYGMTEVTCSCLGWDPNLICEDFSVGEPNPNVEIKLVDGDGIEVEGRGPDARGEVWVRGPNIMKGYWKNEKATRETIVDDGWLRTGDVAFHDARGRFYIVDRIKELIKVKGLQVAPAELESTLLEHPSVADVCVVGVSDANKEEHPRAYVVLRDNKASPSDIARFIAGKVAPHKRLTGGVMVVSEIKKNPSGKILRRHYREEAKKEAASHLSGTALAKL